MTKLKPPITIPAKYIKKVRYSKLEGRILTIPSNRSKSKEKFVLISGLHTSHERMMSFAYFLADYGEVIAIDLPGFGGMASFTKIGKSISYESYAEYIYTVLKTQKLTNNVTIFAVSIGGQFVTRMFQMYPESQTWVKKCIGFVTFGAGKDFNLSPVFRASATTLAFLASSKLGSRVIKLIAFNPVSLHAMLLLFSKIKRKMHADDQAHRKLIHKTEYYHWRINDRQTHAKTSMMMFSDDLRNRSQDLINVPMHNVITKEDQYFDDKEVNKTMRDLYSNYTPHYLASNVHMPSMVADKSEVVTMFDQSMIDEIMGETGRNK